MKENLVSDSLCESIQAYFENNLTAAQAEELTSWIGEDKENLAYLTETGKLWHASGLLIKKDFNSDNGWKSLLEKIEDDDVRPVPRPSLTIAFRTLVRIAAAAVVLALVTVSSLLIFRKNSGEKVSSFYETIAPKGSRSVISLPDGSKIWLNSGTTLRYDSDFGKKTREIYLEGEAYFSVAENKNIPFRVSTNDIRVTALGTSFNVKAYADENLVETTLEKGKVQIEPIGSSVSRLSQPPVYLKPNQKAIFTKTSGNISINEKAIPVVGSQKTAKVEIPPLPIKVDTLVDTRLSTSWKDNKWVFKSEKLNKLIPILERRYDITISFVDTTLCDYKFTGTIKEESLEQVLKALTLAAPIRFSVNHNQVFMYEDQGQISRYLRQSRQQNK